MPSPSETNAAETRPLDDGGPAFPRPDWNGSWKGPDTFSGMSLRDAAALAVLPAVYADAETYEAWRSNERGPYSKFVAEAAYSVADAMLAERAKAVR